MKYFLRFVFIGIGLSFLPPVYASFFTDLIQEIAAHAEIEQEIDATPPCTLSANDAYLYSIDLLSDGRQADAEDLISSAIQRYRADPNILLAKAVLERSRWNKSRAKVWFQMLRRKGSGSYFSDVANLYMALEQHKEVVGNMTELIRISDEHPNDVYLLWLSAIQCREQSRGMDTPKELRSQMAKMGGLQYEKLLAHFRVGPVMLHQSYANILDEDLGKYEKALHHRLLAVSMEAKGWSLEGLATTLHKLKDYNWANAVWARTLRIAPNDAVNLNKWGETLYENANYEVAKEKYIQALDLDPRNGSWWLDLGFCEGKLGNDKEQFECYKKSVTFGCNNALSKLAWCYEFGHGTETDKKKACELYQLSAEKTDSIYAWWRLAGCYAFGVGAEKDIQRAIGYYQIALEINPNHWKVLHSYARLLLTTEDNSFRDYSQAVMLAEKSVGVEEQYFNLNTLAEAYEKNGQYELAVQTQERLIKRWLSEHAGEASPQEQIKRLEKYNSLKGQSIKDTQAEP